VHAPREEKSDDSKDRFYEELEQVFRDFSKYHVKILLGDFNEKTGERRYFQTNTLNDILQKDSNDNGVS
jgi:endonuclease/exonuclease/phosphatase family metal-dependent hydrolase